MYELFSIVQVNLIGILLMAITLISLVKNFRSGIVADRLFFLLSLSVMFVCFFEIMGYVFDGRSFYGAIALNRFFNSILFAVNPFPAFLWALYAHCKVYRDEASLFRAAKVLSLPLLTIVLLSILNLFTDVFFSISDGNIYTRAPLFVLSTALSAIYILYVVGISFKERKRIEKSLCIPLLSFMILPIIGLITQFFFYGVSMLWVCVSISVIIVFNHVQNDYSITDWLTGLYNRRHLDGYLEQMCQRKRSNLLVGIMLDIDNFKSINDNFGHLVGDDALKSTATLLKNARHRSYVARFAGDEFIIILEVQSSDEIHTYINTLNNSTNHFNAFSGKPYNIKFSIGYSIYSNSEIESPLDFLYSMDAQMYLSKVENKKRAQL